MTAPRLSRDLVASLDAQGARGASGVELPPAAAMGLPEAVVQFGTGAFLRGFADYFVDEANRAGRFGGSIVAVSSTGSQRNLALNQQNGLFTLVTQGMEGGAARQSYRVIASISRSISAHDEWEEVLALARDPNIRLVISNTTEVGISLDESDRFDLRPPRSFPGKLTRFLAERGRAFHYEASKGLIVVPCELIDDNGATLRGMVLALAHRWRLGARFEKWVEDGIVFCNTLVDRIVPGVLPALESDKATAPFGYSDALVTACESYASFAIEGNDALRERLGFVGADSRIAVVPDVRPYRARKVRVLNGGHTITVPVALLAGLETVRDACTDERVGRFMRRVILDEIVPTVDVPDAGPFARAVLDRFANPFIRHALIDITLHGTAKMRVRVVPSVMRYRDLDGRQPTSLAFGFAAYLAFMRGEVHARWAESGITPPDDHEGERVRLACQSVDWSSDAAVVDFAIATCADLRLWRADLSVVPGFVDAVADHLLRITRIGIAAALDAHLTETANT
ncbi:MAG: tagaturonate reductase [Gemmatimonadaceae bacterium]